MGERVIGRIGGVELRATPAALIGLLMLWVALSVAGLGALAMRPIAAILGGLAAALLHFVAGIAHHLGHAIAARHTGYPMQAVRFGRLLLLATSVYPEDEPELPARLHIQRALGGPIGSMVFSLLAAGVALAMPSDSPAFCLAAFVAADSLLVYTLGVMLPLGFTDMSTILYWRGK